MKIKAIMVLLASALYLSACAGTVAVIEGNDKNDTSVIADSGQNAGDDNGKTEDEADGDSTDDAAAKDAASAEGDASKENGSGNSTKDESDNAGSDADKSADVAGGNPDIPIIGQFPQFSSHTIKDEAITDSIFSDYDLTVVNIWATWCPPCVGEIPELGEWYKELPPNVNLVGLIIDVGSYSGDDDTYKSTALDIMSKSNADYPVIKLDDEKLMMVSMGFDAIPSTVFVDRNGNVLDRTVVGASPESYKAVVEEYIK